MCERLKLYNELKTVPAEAKKAIQAGRLKGKTDINPMWRIKMLTKHFGICGFGWKIVVDKMWIEEGANGERTANVQISLYIRDPETKEWSDGIVGIGGSALIAKESNGLYTDDDCFKKAYTDAISISCKALGMAADVYYEKDPDSKYTGREVDDRQLPFPEAAPLTYETALELVYNGKALKDIYKTERASISNIYNAPDTPANVKEAICIINAKINEAAKK